MIYNTLQAKAQLDDTRLALQEFWADSNTANAQFLKDQFLPMLANAHFFEAVWKFEEFFPIGRKAKKDEYVQEHLQKLEHFF